MTTPDTSPAPDAEGSAPSGTTERVTRPEPARTGPDRSGSAAPTQAAAHAGAATPPVSAPVSAPPRDTVRDPEDLAINNAVAGSVKTAYDVLAETVEQGRKAAEQFRVGGYNVRDVPDDVRHLAGNLLGLARQLSAATFDICEAMLRQTGGAMAPPPPGSTYVPPFPHMPPITAADRQPDYSDAPPAPGMPSPLNGAKAQAMRLAVRFVGTATAASHTAELTRPIAPTAPTDILCAPLATTDPDAPALTGAAFAADLAGGGLIATITVPPGQARGVYAGVVTCSTQTIPLGLLVVEITG